MSAGAAEAPTVTVDPVPLGKGRATPKRSQAQRRRTGPVPPPPATRKEAAARKKAQRAEDRRQGRASGRGSVRQPVTMLARDAGPVRAFVRDLVDGRRSVAVLVLPVALALVVVQLFAEPRLVAVITRIWLATLVTVIFDSAILGFAVRRRVRAQFPQEGRTRGHVFYALMRATVLRRLRQPAPRVRPPALLRR